MSRISIVKGKLTGCEEVIDKMPEIGECLYFEFYDIVWCRDQPDKPNDTNDPRRIALWICIYHVVVSDM